MKPIVCIAGTDGAGKTAITDAIESLIRERGIPMTRVWSRFNNYLSKPLLAMTKLSGHNHYKYIGDVYHGFHDFENLSVYREVFALLQIVDVNIATWNKISRQRKEDHIMLCERGPWDSLVDVISDTDLTAMENNVFGRLMVRQMLGQSQTYLISRDLDNIFPLREELKGDYKMEKKYAIYHRLAAIYGWTVIENNGHLDDAIQTIISDMTTKGIIE